MSLSIASPIAFRAAPPTRRVMLRAGAVTAIGAAVGPPSPSAGRTSWPLFRQHFILDDSRVVDTGNAGVSHSEGQGYGLLLAAAYDEQPLFDRMLAWTLRNLTRPEDKLLAWRFVPDVQTQAPTDRNNASDGDLLVAWALARAAVRWRSREYLQQAQAMARDFLRLNTIEVAGRLLIRPGTQGFDHGEHVVVNPSYAVFPALRELGAMLPDPRWARLEADMLSVIAEARFGRHGLLADWVEAPRGGGRYRMATEWPARFSWDAVRVPLYMTWAGLQNHRALDSLMDLWFDPTQGASPPAWWDLRGENAAPYGATPGIVAVARLLLAGRLAEARGRNIPFPAIATAADYYNAVLIMLCLRAAEETALNGQHLASMVF